jgi:hypothetical protein
MRLAPLIRSIPGRPDRETLRQINPEKIRLGQNGFVGALPIPHRDPVRIDVKTSSEAESKD